MTEAGQPTPYDLGQREGFRRALEGERPWWSIPNNPRGEYRGNIATKPFLGNATTRQIIEELYARMIVQLAQPEHKLDLHGRVVDS
jgi:hypothetical protein